MIPSLSYTHDFVLSTLPSDSGRILEIGCGNGALAKLLLNERFDMVAMDSDPEQVRLARASGVEARVLSWPAKIDASFDAVLFTRSLHHIEALDAAVEAAVAVLNPGGRIIVEDFRVEGGSERASGWFEQSVRDLAERGAFRASTSLAAILAKAAPDDHDHDLHSSDAIAASLKRHGAVARSGAAYYFRYVEPELTDARYTEALLADELQQIASERIDPLGQRFVLTPNPS